MTHVTRRPSFVFAGTVALALLGSACSDPEPAGSSPDPDPSGGSTAVGGSGGSGGALDPSGDVEAPSVVSTSPLDGAVGVTADARIVITFSEPMDEDSVEAAYQSEALPASAVALKWNEASDELTIVPLDGLAYAEGGPEVPALSYDITLGTAATDLAGNPLDAPLTLEIATLRHLTHALPVVPELTGYMIEGSLALAGEVQVGDQVVAHLKREVRGFMTFDLSEVPDGVELETVTLRAPQTQLAGAPDDELGALHAEPIFFDALDAAAFSYASEIAGAPILTQLGEVIVRHADLATLVSDDLENREARENRSQYRLRYLGGKNDDDNTDKVWLSAEGTVLELVYLAP